MDPFVLIIDDLGRVEAILERVLEGLPLRTESFSDPGLAKRRLIESTPVVIISLATFQNHPDGGFRLAKELSGHSELSTIPLLLVSENLSEDVIRQAADTGAKALIPWPVTVESLRNRLRPYLAEFFPVPKVPVEPAPIVATPAPRAPTAATTSPSASASSDHKIQLAQQLLAKVLHNLKTSALLEVVDLEDVPQVVMEITRAVCGGSSGAKVPEQKPVERPLTAAPIAQPAAKVAEKSEIAADLDRAFGLKKT